MRLCRKQFFLIPLFNCLTSIGQISDCPLLIIKKDLSKKNYAKNDTVKITFQNISDSILSYDLQVYIVDKNEIYFSDTYTKIFQ